MTDSAAAFYEALRDEIETVLIGKTDLVEHLTLSLLSDGHVLMEGVPGVAKTTVANLFARATGLDVNRVQMTPDLMPADITGTHVYNQTTGEFTLQKGPVFGNVVVADEINRTTPKTQSALLEAMQERTVTVQGETLALPEPFFVVATQNPIEMEGTFELPVAQRDRFQLKLDVGLPTREEERRLLARFDSNPDLGPQDVTQVVTHDDLAAARADAANVYIDERVVDYILDIVAATRNSADVDHGVSPRGALALQRTSKARAAVDGRDYVIPDDVKALAVPALNHRLVLSTDAEISDVSSVAVIEDVLDSVTPPGAEDVRPNAA
ncbi:MoxR family ATPase (plasmid) [Halarchaeum sp. CBA1220]|uniref:AAA family ATPase n=1 Tax=Halarchaeum sp. CBA1220 TaxID=1853682 RepID=UPI000F3A8CF2|nr:MoxR family ATPase [Halarchaeum sp. CBA1220]QLC35132.1 MoxR family ATPase [Halarchaeum sp. CBA1220]